MYLVKILFFLFIPFICLHANAQTITSFAGKNGPGFSGDGGPATVAKLHEPFGVAVDAAGNVYIADGINKRIREITTDGIINTIAGNGNIGFNGDGIPATDAAIDVTNVAVGPSGIVFITDGYNNRVRIINADGSIATIAGNGSPSFGGDGGPATDAALNYPVNLAIDAAGNAYIADVLNNRIRKVNTNGLITTVAGNGAISYNGDGEPATSAQLNEPYGVAVDDSGTVYITEFMGQRIRAVNTAGIISTFAGTGMYGYSGDGGQAAMAQLSYPQGVTVDHSGNVYVVDYGNERLRKIDATGIITTFAGNGISGFKGDGGPATAASFNDPVYACIDANGNVYVADRSNDEIREIFPFNVGIKNTFAVSTGEILQIWPQPNDGNFKIYVSSPVNESVQIFISNLLGQKTSELSAITNTETKIHLDTPPGVYFITAITSQGMQTTKVAIK